MSDVVVSGIKVEGVRAALLLRLGDRGRQQATPTPGSLENIRIENFTATRPAASDWCSPIVGLPGHRIRNLVLKDVVIHVQGGRTAPPPCGIRSASPPPFTSASGAGARGSSPARR